MSSIPLCFPAHNKTWTSKRLYHCGDMVKGYLNQPCKVLIYRIYYVGGQPRLTSE